jgi:protein SMG6
VQGTVYFEGLLEDLEKANKLKFEDFLSSPMCLREGLGYTGLALIAAQKLFLFLGDLARYKDQANETPSNYGVSRQYVFFYLYYYSINF